MKSLFNEDDETDGEDAISRIFNSKLRHGYYFAYSLTYGNNNRK
jgi:hypothetical protein